MTSTRQHNPIAGQCLCGAVTVRITADPVGARMCWCRDCQYIASGSPTVNVLFPADAVEFSGPVSHFERIADSGNTVLRGFCTHCGAQLFSESVNDPAAPIRIRVGTLDNPGDYPPQAIIWAASAPDWAVFDTDLPVHDGPPPPAGGR